MRILVVDDDDVVRQVTAMTLMSYFGHKVNAISNGETGLRNFLSHKNPPFDLVVTDLEMPGMSGIELAEAIKAKSPATPVVLVSGSLPPLEEIPTSVDFALSKPFELTEIERILRAVEAPVSEGLHVLTDQMLWLVTKNPAHAMFRFSPDGFLALRHLQSCRRCAEYYAVLGESVAFSA